MTDEQIAHNMGISRSTLNEWKKKHLDISDTIKKGKEIIDYEVENALLQQAMKGNVTACIFWLKNRMPDKYGEKAKGGSGDVTILDDIDPLTAAIEEAMESGFGEKKK